MQLVEAGRLDLDAPIERYLSGFSVRRRWPHAAPITIRSLMTHHSGLPTDRIEGMWRQTPVHFSTVIDALRDDFRAFPPGLLHCYSNLGFSVLGTCVERVAGVQFESLVRAGLLEPLGMHHARVEARPPSGSHAAKGHDAQGRPAAEPGLRDTPAGGPNVSPSELLNFARMWFADGLVQGGPVLASGTLAEMARRQNADVPLDADLRVGLGWHYANHVVPDGGPVLAHSGSTPNFHAELLLLPEHRLAVAVMANSAHAAETVSNSARSALRLMFEAKTGIAQGRAPRAPATPDPRYLAPAVGDWIGHYDTPAGFVEVKADGNRLVAQIDGSRLRLAARPSGYVGLEYRVLGLVRVSLGDLEQLEFTLSSIDGRHVLLARRGTELYLAGERLSPLPVPAAWQARLGRYAYLGTDPFIAKQIEAVTLSIDQGFLIGEADTKTGPQRLILAPDGDQLAFVRGLGRGRGDAVQVIKGPEGDEVLAYSGMRFRQLSSGDAA